MTQQENKSTAIRTPWERLLPLLMVFSGTTLLALVLLIPLCCGTPSLQGRQCSCRWLPCWQPLEPISSSSWPMWWSGSWL